MSATQERDEIAVERAFELAGDLFAAAESYLAALEDVVAPAEALVDVDARYRVAVRQAGYADNRPPARELAVEALTGVLGCFRPYLPSGSVESAQRASACLLSDPPFSVEDEEDEG